MESLKKEVHFYDKENLINFGSKYVTNDRYQRYGRYSRGKEHFSKYSLYFKRAKYCIEQFCKLRDIKIVPNSFSQSDHGSVYCKYYVNENLIATIRVSDHPHPNTIYCNLDDDFHIFSRDGFFLTTKNFIYY
jgi:hypothetical protein